MAELDMIKGILEMICLVLLFDHTQSFTHSSRQETREAAAHLLGVLAGHLPSVEVSQLAQDLLKDVTSEVSIYGTFNCSNYQFCWIKTLSI